MASLCSHRWRLTVTVLLLFLAACTGAAPAGAPPTAARSEQQADEDLLAIVNPTPQEVRSEAAEVLETRRFTVSEHIEIANLGPGQTHKHNLWLALIQSHLPFQQVTSLRYAGPDYQVVEDEYGNRYLQFDFGEIPVGEPVVIDLNYEVEVSRLQYDLGDCSGELPTFSTTPEFLIESANPEIIALSGTLSAGLSTPCDQARAVYDHVAGTLSYTANNGDWGAMAALGPASADCTEYASLFIALCRAAAVPAQYVEGLLYQGADPAVSAQQEHAWAEVFMPRAGWMPVDPTLGRLASTRERYFARFPADHIIVTYGRHPSTLRGKSYFAHLYWGVDITTIQVQNFAWTMDELP